ncbi:hypothetical protein PM035_12870 [Halorubrum ezzemoulense]|uniref:hypothetical protein n=1 Tax=Halorubrum ezzemoulense TaxID=337243 RepID=UPI00232C3D65|nr:hypothetical protein [Halorubrum ezzemoulense]MDB2261818.1 hypothetical protein [Halorubrum ezzemoulense]MDB2268580.1 hypothetical protein [Halorubrum ezzemoulense]
MSDNEKDNRIRELEERVEDLENTVSINRRSAEKRLSLVTSRIAKLEELALESSLGVEAELSEMERILCGLDDEPSVGTSRHRAFILANLWRELNIEKLTVGDVVNLERHQLKMLISREEQRNSGSSLEGMLGNKQIVRAMDSFDKMFDGKAERRKNTNTGVNELLIPNPDGVIWNKQELYDRMREED